MGRRCSVCLCAGWMCSVCVRASEMPSARVRATGMFVLWVCPRAAGIMFKDVTTLLLDHKAFHDTTDIFVERYRNKGITAVAGQPCAHPRHTAFSPGTAFDSYTHAHAHSRSYPRSRWYSHSGSYSNAYPLVTLHCISVPKLVG